MPSTAELRKKWVAFKLTYNFWPFLIWFALNIILLGVGTYYFFYIDDKPNPFARVIGHLNMLNLGLTLLPVSRDSFFQRFFRVPFEQGLLYHRFISRTLLFLVTLHGASWIGYYAIRAATDTICSDDSSCYPNTLISSKGLTGIFCWVFMFILAIFAFEYFRRRFFEFFYISHHLFLVIIGLAIAHSFEVQEPWSEGWGQDLLIYYLAPGVILYIFDRFLRIYRTAGSETKIFVLENVKSGVTCLQVGSNVKFKAGQYCFLNCPRISRFQWHPYSIASGENDEYLSFTIKSMGNGTWSDRLNQLARRLEGSDSFSGTDGSSSFGSLSEFELKFQNVISFRLDGPYGTDFLKTRKETSHFCFCAGGIGITPIVSIIQTLLYNLPVQLRSITLYWVVKSTDELLWFGGFLRDFQQKENDAQFTVRMKLKIFVTGKGKLDGSVEYIPPKTYEAYDSLIYDTDTTENTFLNPGSSNRSYSSSGMELSMPSTFPFSPERPDMLRELNDVADSLSHPNSITTIELLSCGPPGFDHPVAMACQSITAGSLPVCLNFTSQTFML